MRSFASFKIHEETINMQEQANKRNQEQPQQHPGPSRKGILGFVILAATIVIAVFRNPTQLTPTSTPAPPGPPTLPLHGFIAYRDITKHFNEATPSSSHVAPTSLPQLPPPEPIELALPQLPPPEPVVNHYQYQYQHNALAP